MDSIRIKRGPKAQLPSELPLGELAFCTDTRELYVGMGEGIKPRPVTNTELTDKLTTVSSELDTIENKIKEIQTGLISFRETYNNDKVVTENVIEMIGNGLNNNTTQIENNSNEINNITNRVTNTESNITSIKNDYTTVEVVVPNDGIVKKYVMEDNKMGKIKRKYIHCELSATEWKQAWEDLGAGTNNNNGSIWIPFYWAVNKNKIIDVNLSLRDLNKWNWNSLGYSKIGVYGLGSVNETGCYVYVENKAPTEQTMGLSFSICITEIYE